MCVSISISFSLRVCIYVGKATPWYRRASLFRTSGGFSERSWAYPGRVLGRVLGAFWEVIGGLGGFFLCSWPHVGEVLGASWGTFGRSWAHFGVSWVVLGGLEGSWARLGVSLGEFRSEKSPTWPQFGSQNGAKMAQKSIQNSIIFLMPLGNDLWVDYGGFWVPKSSQVGTKMGSKIDVKFERRFLIIRAPAAAGARKIKI